MTVFPEATPKTRPVVEPTVATAVLLLLHVPPATASVNANEEPTQTFEGPVTGAGIKFTVINLVTVPQIVV